tara:strand:+ start:691 stop:1053 length:363 start_codon:yes stop_codon:yes gene_type:complete
MIKLKDILTEGYKKNFNSIKKLEAAILGITDAKTIRVVLEVGYEMGYSEQYIFPQTNKDWKNKVKSAIKELEKDFKTTTWNGKPAPSPKWYLEEKKDGEYISYVRHKFQDKHGRSRYGGR